MLVIESSQAGQIASSTTIGLMSIPFSIELVAKAFATSRSSERLHRHASDQWLEVAQAIPMNIAEGNARRSLRDRARFLDIARGLAFNLYWYIEALWALMWVGRLIDELPFDEGVGSELASLCPAIQRNEAGTKLSGNMQLRTREDLFRMLDLYYRLHWWPWNSQLNGKDTGSVRLDVIMERRKALEWVMDPSCDWDNVEMST